MEVLKWLRAQDLPCPWSRDECRAAAHGHDHIVQWIDQEDDESDCDREELRERERMNVMVLEDLARENNGDYDSDGRFDSCGDDDY